MNVSKIPFTKLPLSILILLWASIWPASHLQAQEALQQLVDRLEQHIEEHHIPGAMISIVRADSVLYTGGIGYADLAKSEAATAEHLFRQGSISKSITGLGIMQYLHGQAIDLQTPILEIDPSIPLKNPWAREAPITIEHLLEHSAGFDDLHLHAVYNLTDKEEPSTAQLVQTHHKSLTARWKPGTRKAYSNPGYVLAGHMLETHSGMPYHAYLKTHLLEPLGMPQSGFYYQSPPADIMAQGCRYKGSAKGNVIQPFTQIQGGPAGAFCSNAIEMARLLQFMLNRQATGIDSSVFTDAVFERIEHSKATLAGEAGLPGGYGIGNHTAWRYGHVFNGHGGAIDGFSSYYTYSREADLGIAVAINRSGNARGLVDEILQFYLGEATRVPFERKTQPIPEEIARTYQGFYAMKSPRMQLFAFTETMLAGIKLDFEQDWIIVRNFIGRAKDTLYYAGNHQFYARNEGIPTTILLQDENGQPVCWKYETYFARESHVWRIIANLATFLSLILPLIFLAYGIIWGLVRMIQGNVQDWEKVLVLWLTSACYSLMLLGMSLSMEYYTDIGTLNMNSGLLYASSLALLPGAIASIFFASRLGGGKGFRRYYRLTTMAIVILVIFLGSNGFIGLKLWAY